MGFFFGESGSAADAHRTWSSAGGIAAIHVTVARTTPGWRQLIHVARRNFLPLHVLGNVATGMHWNEPLMQSNLYDLDRVRELGVGEGFDEIYELPVRHAIR